MRSRLKRCWNIARSPACSAGGSFKPSSVRVASPKLASSSGSA